MNAGGDLHTGSGLANGNAGSKETDPLFISRVQIAD
jgi:hypothetical protein